jgi:hypothetical protein
MSNSTDAFTTDAFTTAAAALQARLEAIIDPVEQFTAATDEGRRYVGFTQRGHLRVTVEATDDGAYAVVSHDEANNSQVLAMAPSPVLAVERALALS